MRKYSVDQLKSILEKTDTDTLITFIDDMLPMYEAMVRMTASITPLQKQIKQEKVICKMETLVVLLRRGEPF